MKKYNYTEPKIDWVEEFNRLYKLDNIETRKNNSNTDEFKIESVNYPYTTISYTKDPEILFVEVEVPGYKRDELDLEVSNGKLYITGSLNKSDDEVKYIFVQKQTSIQDFERIILLNEKYHTTEEIKASLEDGILTIILKPSEKDIKRIVIE